MSTDTTSLNSSSTTTSDSTDTGYLHPSVTSTISSNDVSYESTSGNIKMFSAYTSEKGIDNKIQLYGSATEFAAKNGNPNIKKYGQAAYNIMNWLEAGGEVYGLRLTADNAGYAHAFLNILTKTGTKKVLDKNGFAIDYDNITLKPAVAYTEVNNASEELLEYELTRTRNETTVDGFLNHLLFTIYPTGRGKSYNNLGFRISLNQSYDNQYDFRVYNFEIVHFDTNNSANIVEGPFYVSMCSDALSNSNESMFIEDVINKYCSYFKCIFNETAFTNLCTSINPDVNPWKIDVLTGITATRNNAKDTFYSKKTMKFEDVHIAVERYDSAGKVITDSDDNPQINTVDATDLIEQTILLVDNSFRKKTYQRYTDSIAYMTNVFNSVTNGNYDTMINEILTTPDGVNITSGTVQTYLTQLNQYYSDIQNLVTEFNTSKLESDFNKISSENTLIESSIDTLLIQLAQLLAYQKAINMDSTVLDIDSQLNNVYNKFSLKQVVDIKSISKKDDLNDISIALTTLKSSGDVLTQIEGLNEQLSNIKGIIDYFTLMVTENSLSNTELTVAASLYNSIIDKYNAVFSNYISDANRTALIVKIFNDLDVLINEIYNIARIVIVNIDLIVLADIITKRITSIIATMIPVVYTDKNLFDTKMTTDTGKSELTSSIKTNIDSLNTSLSVMKSIVYTNQLQDFNSPARLQEGSDGDLDESNTALKTATEKKLMVKAYKGLIDDSVTNRKIIPFKVILDANYPTDVKNAIITLVRDVRKDIFFYADCNLLSSPQDCITWRSSEFPVSSQFLGIFTPNFVVYDEYNGKDIKVTSTYFIASKLPEIFANYGLQYPMAGNKRGTIDGFKSISFIPNNAYKEELYNRQLNYVESDTKRTRFGSQLTADTKRTPLSDINNVLTALDIKINVEDMADDYLFEFNDDETISSFQYSLNDYLTKYVTNRACDSITATVYSSDYDKQQHILRVSISVTFRNVIERIIINIDVVR